MRNYSVVLLLFFGFLMPLYAQDLNCTVSINSAQVQQSNRQAVTALETAIKDFMNNTRWSTKTVGRSELIDCNIIIIIERIEENNFAGKIQVQSSRPVYNSGYNSPVFNYMDNNFAFQYILNEPLIYNENSYSSELVAVLAFYANIIVGMDADTFSLNGGSYNLNRALNMLNLAQQGGGAGWRQDKAENTRYGLISDLLNSSNTPFRQAMYQYHRNGLDQMYEDPAAAKAELKKALEVLSQLHSRRPNAFLTRIFFDAKADEVLGVFSGGPDFAEKQAVVDLLTKISPLNGSRWNRM